jgi:type II secretory pathway component PulK
VLNRAPGGRRDPFDEPSYVLGLVNLFTPVSGRLININTASAEVFQLFPDIDANLAQMIISGPGGRAGPDQQDGTADDMPFRAVTELQRTGLPPPLVARMAPYCTVKSLCFEARISVDLRGFKREYTAILRRNGPKDIQTLNLHWK